MNRLIASVALASILVFFPQSALAHILFEGLDNFYNGLFHPLFIPAHVMLLVAIGLLFGQKGLHETQVSLVSFWVAVFIGLIVAFFSWGGPIQILVLINGVMVGLLVAISPGFGTPWYTLIGIITGFTLGLDSAQDSLVGMDKFMALLGSGIGISFLVLYPVILAKTFNKKMWQQIGIRIIGSWIAASSLLVLAFSISQG